MNSEKVKDIKESLQQEIHLTEYVDGAYSENVSLDLLKDVLTIINELQSENEELKSPKFANWKVKFFKAQEEIKKLKEEKQQAVKNTAKEICDLILEHWQGHDLVECDWLIVAISEKYGVDMK